MTEPQVIWRKLRVPFARSVTFPDQVPAVMQVMVYPLAEPSAPEITTTFVNPPGVQDVVLARDTEVVFELIPSHLAGMTEPLLYRIQWRAGVTGRTFTYDFAMPDQDIAFGQLANLGNIIDGQVYLRQQDLGVPGRVARLNVDGHVVDASGQVVATVGALDTLSGQLQAERLFRQQADAAVAAAAQSALETQITSVLSTTAANLESTRQTLAAADSSERSARIAADAGLSDRIDSANTEIAAITDRVEANEAALDGKADVVNGKIALSLIPDAARTQGVQVPDEAAMLALTLDQVQQFDFAIRPDGIWALMGTDPSNINHWVQLNKVLSVNGEIGNVVIDLDDVAAEGGTVAISQVEGLDDALAEAGNAADLEALTGRVAAIEDDDTLVRTEDGVISHELNDEHMAYLNSEGKVTNKAGEIVVVPGSGSVTQVNGKDGIVELTLSDVAAAGGEVPIVQVAELSEALESKVDATDERLSDARPPTSHAASHAADGDDPLEVTRSQVQGLDAILTNNGLTPTSNHETRIQTLELGGGTPGGGGEIAKANWFDGTEEFTVSDPAALQTDHNVLLKGPFSRKTNGDVVYNADGVPAVGETPVWAYITPNGHLQLREWNESNPPDPEMATKASVDALSSALGTKASQGALDLLAGEVADKADQSSLESLSGTIADKADQSTVSALATEVEGKADQSEITDLTEAINTKASASDLAAAQSAITALQGGKADLSGGTVPLSQLPTIPRSKVDGLDAILTAKADLSGSGATVPLTQLPTYPRSKVEGLNAALAGKADLDANGKVLASQMPPLALNTITVVSNRGAMLAQTSAQVQPGDFTIINATSDTGTYALIAPDPSNFANWAKLPVPDGSVSSVNGQTGTVTLTAADVGARSLGDLLNISDINTLQSTLDNKASTTALSTGLASKTSPLDVQNLVSGATPVKQQVSRVATSAIASLSGAQSVDGALATAGTLVLLTAQPSSVSNGVWQVNSGAWTRPADFANGSYLLRGTLVFVSDGNTNANTIWQQTAASGSVGTNNNNWARIGYSAPPFAPVQGNGMAITGNSFAVRPATGVSVSTAGVGADFEVVARKARGTVPPGNANTTIVHNLNTNSPMVQIIDSGGNLVMAGVTVTGLNSVSVEFGTPPASGQYRYVVIG
ncbi:hypothetical protein SEA_PHRAPPUCCINO_194 [Mycobacterium phage Phrappuccino]|uniref:Minor tail protein n=1 Tax=Mycobacterium phage Phrappuccino TaxID=2591223 RepID=A0A514DE27_9CAUD|nr:virion structural protein [Mycobacterium phage Phrappuccino]QDH91869.1 hypothetical protein SEA_PHRAPPUCCINO_194 [Mycobacterium phage Phrappuccino]QIQ63335.1 hypothetical protein SEA_SETTECANDELA_219 [Mycobacterium phage Settecandela]